MIGWFKTRASTSARRSAAAAAAAATGSTLTACHAGTRRAAHVEPLEGRLLFAADPSVFALGANLQFQSEVTRDHALADLVKATTGFRDLAGNMASVDANGWPTEDFTVPLWGHIVDPGRYTISFTGPATTAVSTVFTGTGTLTNLSAPGATAQNYVLDVPEGSGDLSLKFTGTAGQVKDLKVIQPGNTDGQFWATKYVNFLKGLHPESIRVMDLIKTNFNTTSTWAERPLLTDATFNEAGVPWEYVISLANELDTHLWIPVPVRATDDYVRQLAAQVKSTLEPGLDVFLEYSNETWSTLHEPGKYNLAQAKAEVAADGDSDLKYDGTNDPNKWQYRRNARRLKEIVELFQEVWTTGFNGTAPQADPVNDRVKAILGGRASEEKWFDDMLKYIDENHGAPKDYFYGIAGAWYFSLNKFRDELIAGRNDLTVDQVLEGMEASVSLYESERRFERTAERGEPWGLKLAAYELGADSTGGLNTAAKADAHRDRRMTELMERFIRAFEDQGGVLAPWYSVGARQFNTPHGAWTVTDDLDNLRSPKAEAFRAIRDVSLPPLGEEPPPTAPEVGVVQVEGAVRTDLTDGQSGAIDFGSVALGAAAARTRTFQVTNSGTEPLSLVLGAVPAGFEVADGLPPLLGPGVSDTLTLRLVAGGELGERSGTVSITTNDADENPFTFAVRGAVTAPPTGGTPVPEVTLLANGSAVASGATLDLGTRGAGAPAPTLSLTVRNDGDGPLELGAVTAPAGFTLTGVPASGVLAPGDAAALTLTLVAADAGTYGGAVSMPTNDADEGTFTLNVTGTVTSTVIQPPPDPTPDTPGLAVASVTAVKMPAVVISGSGGKAAQGTLSLTIRNDTGAAFTGPVVVAVHGSTDGVLDAGDVPLVTVTKTLKLAAGATGKAMKVKVPLGSLPIGQQSLLGTATANGESGTTAGPAVSVEAARVNLVGEPGAGPAGKPLTPGKRATLLVPLRNTGNVPTARSPVAYTLLFTTDGTAGTTVFTTTATGNVNLKPAAARPQKLSLTLPPGALAPGSYTVIVQLSAELNQTNGQAVALLPVTVV